jgi:7-cyano-7-deazaguanine synthase
VSKKNKAIVLSSGGLDSTTAMAMAKEEGYEIYSLSFRYGQRHALELEAAQRVAKALGAKEHLVMDIDLARIGGSALTDDLDVPKARTDEEIKKGIPVTYVPGRNTIFLSYALAWAEVVGASDIFLGVNAIDYSGYPDCRPEYIKAFEHLANLATKAGAEGLTPIRIRAPLMRMTKAEIIRKGVKLGVDYGMTHSCYDPSADGKACGYCDSCLLRKKGFREAGVADPTDYID